MIVDSVAELDSLTQSLEGDGYMVEVVEGEEGMAEEDHGDDDPCQVLHLTQAPWQYAEV